MLNLAAGKLRRSDGLSIVFNDNTAGEKVLRDEELFQRTRKLGGDLLAVGDDVIHFSASTRHPNLSRPVRSRAVAVARRPPPPSAHRQC